VGQTYRPENDKREYTRVKAEFTLTFKGPQIEGKGRLVDLSIRGCSLETDQIPRRGDILQLTLKMPHARPPVDIGTAVVRFTQGIRVGIEFLRINEKSEKELREFVEERLVPQKATQEA
jgi:c-di-GMP-binding flagellar brake protein YcgR